MPRSFLTLIWFQAARGLVAFAALGVGGIAAAQEGALSELYAARPPAGASYVRVVNPDAKAIPVRVAKGPMQQLGGSVPAGSYAIVSGDQAFSVLVGSTEVAGLRVRPDSFQTLVLRHASAGYAFTAIDDTSDTQDALKAELRFYNLAQGCSQAALLLSPAGTPVFQAVAAGSAVARSVNPVRAQLSGQCGATSTPPQPLPTMQPGDHLSLFLVGPAKAPALVVQTNRTDPFKR